MYYDERKEVIPEAPVAPTPMILEPWRQCLLKAADLLRESGWCQGVPYDGQKRCVQNAIGFAANSTLQPNAIFVSANTRLGMFLGLDHSAATHQWNDMRGRTKEEVIAALEGAARAG